MDWIEPAPISIPSSFGAKLGGHPIVARTLYQRGFHALEDALAYIDPDHYQPTSPLALPGVSKAVSVQLH